MGTDDYAPPHPLIDLLHRLGSNALSRAKQEYAAIGIVPVMLIEGGEETAAGYRLRQRTAQQFGKEIKYLAVAHHPLRFLIDFVKLAVALQLDKMVNIWGDKHAAVQPGEKLALRERQHVNIQNSDCFHLYGMFGLLIKLYCLLSQNSCGRPAQLPEQALPLGINRIY